LRPQRRGCSAIVVGAFLAAEEDAGWLVSARLRISVRLQRYAERLGEHWESTGSGRGDAALPAHDRDRPLTATFHRRHLLCLRAEGARTEAIEAYRRWRQLLATTVGIAPDPELERVTVSSSLPSDRLHHPLASAESAGVRALAQPRESRDP
jgi:hypothetical protein